MDQHQIHYIGKSVGLWVPHPTFRILSFRSEAQIFGTVAHAWDFSAASTLKVVSFLLLPCWQTLSILYFGSASFCPPSFQPPLTECHSNHFPELFNDFQCSLLHPLHNQQGFQVVLPTQVQEPLHWFFLGPLLSFFPFKFWWSLKENWVHIKKRTCVQIRYHPM